MSILRLAAAFLLSLFKSQRQLILENLALKQQQQVAMLRQSVKRPRATSADKIFWILFSRYVECWRQILFGLHPDTVVRWHRQGFCLYWRWKSRRRGPGRPVIDATPRKLIREMQASNIGWGAPRIHGELLKSLGIDEIISAPRSPWQNPYVERVIGSIRRECLDHVIVFNERHLQRILRDYVDYYHSSRTHLSLCKDPPDSRRAESVEAGNIVALPRVGGLHHRYTRIAA
jgi:hypothetical protein